METDLVCLRCGSFKIVKKGKAFSVMKGVWRQKYQCKKCGRKFNGKNLNMIEPMPFKYQDQPVAPIDWTAYNSSQINEKLMLLDLIDELLDVLTVEQVQKTGRPSSQVRDMLFCMVLKIYTKLSSQRLISDLHIAKEKEYISHVPCYSTLMLYFNDKRLLKVFQELISVSALPLKHFEEQFSIDSSGFSTSKFGRWFDYKFNEEKERRLYRKAHIMIGTRTNVVTSVEITEQTGADSPQLPSLVKKTALNFNIKEVSADKAYSSRDNMELIQEIGAIPYIPFKITTTGKQRGSHIWRTMFVLSKKNPQEFFQHYHKRSNVESTFFMIKQKFNDSLMTKNFIANTNEILCKILCHNLCCLISAYFEFGLKTTFCTEDLEKARIWLKP